MPLDMPERSVSYVGLLTNTDIWDSFQMRPDDVVVCTPPKCGTTWMQSIVMMLIFGKPGMDNGIGDISPWLDAGFRDRNAIAAVFDAQTHRRCIKSHSPLDGITYSPEATYIFVYRHPMDVHFSMRKHVANTIDTDQAHLFPDDISEGFRIFLRDNTPVVGDNIASLDAIVHHYRAAAKWRHLPNVHLFHYADMIRDLSSEMDRISQILGYRFEPKVMQKLVDGATFKTMKSNAVAQSAETASTHFKDGAEFFSSATSNKWEKYLTVADVADYDARILALLPKADRAWLEWGNHHAA